MNTMKTGFLLTAMTLLFISIGRIVGGEQGMVIAFVIAIGMNFFSYFYSDKMVLRMYRAQPITESEAPWVFQVVRELSMKAGIPMPRIYLIPDDQPNAFATGRNPEHAVVAVTQGITRILDRDELAGVLAHEIAHVKNRDILIGTIAATFAGAISMLSHFAFFFGGRDRDSNPLVGLALMILAPVAAMLVQMAISRSREFEADKTGAMLMGRPEPLASALQKLNGAARTIPMDAEPATAHMFIVNPLSGKSMASLFSTHPPMEERVAALMSLREATI
ncbi:MAG: zinc metalloprotease HtpX [Nitrospinota bacterium]|nr:zinc metalloprotease HtpX [Nitrospinota bacterium]